MLLTHSDREGFTIKANQFLLYMSCAGLRGAQTNWVPRASAMCVAKVMENGPQAGQRGVLGVDVPCMRFCAELVNFTLPQQNCL